MKFFKTLIAAGAIAFSTANCADLQGFLDGLVPDTSSIIDSYTSSLYSSEGSVASPVNVGLNSSHYGSVDGANSSFYVTYVTADFLYGTNYTIQLVPYTADADLYTFTDDYTFSYSDNSSIAGSTYTDSCIVTTYYGELYYEVRPVDTAGTAYDLYVW